MSKNLGSEITLKKGRIYRKGHNDQNTQNIFSIICRRRLNEKNQVFYMTYTLSLVSLMAKKGQKGQKIQRMVKEDDNWTKHLL